MEALVECTRDQILEAARQLIIKQGYDATGVAEICREAGISKGAFYYHFQSKQDLFTTLLSDWLNSLDASFATIQNSSASVAEQLEQMAGSANLVLHALEDPIPVFLAFWSKAIQDPQTWQETIQPFRHYQQEFVRMLNSGKESGSLQTSIPTEDASRILVGLAIGILLQGLIFPEEADWQDVLSKAVKIFTSGVERSAV
jgi:AcrR family transcriptional regulator